MKAFGKAIKIQNPFSEKVYGDLEGLQLDLDGYMNEYNYTVTPNANLEGKGHGLRAGIEAEGEVYWVISMNQKPTTVTPYCLDSFDC
jgi:hypothetical protein